MISQIIRDLCRIRVFLTFVILRKIDSANFDFHKLALEGGGIGFSNSKITERLRHDMPNQTGSNVISFKERATIDPIKPLNDLLVVELTIQNIDVARILVDTGSSADIIFKNTLERMEINPSEIAEDPNPIVGLSGEATMTLGTINLLVKADSMTKIVEFWVIDRPTSYNAIVGTPWLNSMQAIPSTYHMCLKFPTPRGTETNWGDRRNSRVCFPAELKRKNPLAEFPSQKKKKSYVVDNALQQDKTEIFWQSRVAEALEAKRELTCEPVISVCLDEAFPDRCVEIGANLSESQKIELIASLKKDFHTFAWAAEDMPGIDVKVTCHEMNVDPTLKPVKQMRQKLGPERACAVNDEVKKLLKVGSITEVRYPDLLANPAVVKKKNGKWRVCVDFTDLNKACPKDSFPLPHINRLVEATTGNKLLSFMDAFSGYNQIMMNTDDQEKSAYITDCGT